MPSETKVASVLSLHYCSICSFGNASRLYLCFGVVYVFHILGIRGRCPSVFFDGQRVGFLLHEP